MGRPLRYDCADGWYHVTSRGIDRRAIFTEGRDYEHFLELLEVMVARFRVPAWLTTGEILGRAAKDGARQVEKYRADVRERLSKGVDPGKSEELRDTFALGSETFRAHVRKLAGHGREAVEPQRLARWLTWPEILDRVAVVTGLTAEACLHQRGGPGRPLALWAARRFGGMTLREVGQMAGGMDYTAVAMAVKRFEQRAAHNSPWRELMRALQANCEK